MKRRILAVLILTVFSISSVFAASSSSSSSSSSANSTTSNTKNAEAINKEEIPDWVKYLRRFEIVTLGSLPFSTIAASTVFQTIRWGQHGFSSDYAPNPLAFTSDAANLTQDDQFIVLYSALATSFVIGVVDLSIFVVKKEKAKKANQSLLPGNISVENVENVIPLPEPSENIDTVNDDEVQDEVLEEM